MVAVRRSWCSRRRTSRGSRDLQIGHHLADCTPQADETLKKDLPGWREYVDVSLHLWLLAIRMPLGAGVAALFGMTEQISGAYAAVAFGFAAPAVLAQLGGVPQVAAAVRGAGTAPEALVPAGPSASAGVTPISRAE
jgi:hypothetical protein